MVPFSRGTRFWRASTTSSSFHQIQKQKEREESKRGQANNGLFRFFRHDHVMPLFRVPVCRGCLRDQRLRGHALGLVVLRMPCADDRCPPSLSRRQSPDPPSIVFDVDWWRRVVFVWRTGGLSMMSSQSRRPLFPVNDGVGQRRGMMDGSHRRRMISSSHRRRGE